MDQPQPSVTSEPTIDEILWRQGVHKAPHMVGKSLDNFEATGRELAARKKFALEFVDSPRTRQAFFFGAPGRGKTHLALAIMRLWIERDRQAVYWPLMQLVEKLKSLMQPGSMRTPDQQLDWLCNFKGLLIVDELGRTRGESWDRDTVVYQMLDRRQDKPTIWISNFNFETLDKIYDEAISSRLKAGYVISWPSSINDYREKR